MKERSSHERLGPSRGFRRSTRRIRADHEGARAGRELELVLHPVPEKPPKSGVKANDLDEKNQVIDPLEKKLKNRFNMTWATLVSKANPDGLWASAYHIKVAVRDGNAVWLSSGNWQSSNQPAVHPFTAKPN